MHGSLRYCHYKGCMMLATTVLRMLTIAVCSVTKNEKVQHRHPLNTQMA